MQGIDETLRTALLKARGMWLHRRVGLAVAWATAMTGVLVLFAIPPRYEATARIFVNTDSILKPLMVGLTVHPNEDQRITMLSRVVISRPNVEKLVQEVGLDAKAKSPEEREHVIDAALRALEFKGGGRDNLYTLSFRDVDPVRARRVVELLAQVFISSSRGGRDEDTQAAKAFIDEQVAVYDKKLQDAENRLKEFRLRYLGMTPGDGKDYFMRMSDTEKLLAQARLELREAERARDAYRAGLASERVGPLAGAAEAPTPLADIDSRIDTMRKGLDALLQRYTESHPDVVGARRVLRELEKQRATTVASMPASAGPVVPAGFTGPHAAEQLKVSLAQAEAAVGSLTTRVAEYNERYNKLRSAAAMVPQLEAEYAQLNRDYDVNKKNYESLAARRESATMSGDMQSVSGVSDFRLVDPPRVSPRPVSPKMAILVPLVMIIALGAGILASYVMHEARPTFLDLRALREVTGLPVLGAVTRIRDERERSSDRRGLLRFGVGVIGLLALFVAAFVAVELVTVRVV